MTDIINLDQRRRRQAKSGLRSTDIGVEPPIEDAILKMRELPAFKTAERISDELLLAGVLIVYDEDPLTPYDRAIKFLTETRESVREGLGDEPDEEAINDGV